MQIIIGDREIVLTAADLRHFGEEAALEAAADDREREEIRARFAALPADGGGQEYRFVLAPLDFQDQWRAAAWARERGLWDGREKTLSGYLLTLLVLLFRLKDWEGFEANGAPLPCTADNKVLVFGQAFGVIDALRRKLVAEEEAERKNSGTSQAG
jgi:hypothetical protein